MNLSPLQANSASALSGAAAVLPQHAAERREFIKAVAIVNASQTFGDDNELVFVFDRTTRRPSMRVVERKTNDVIMQLPPDYVLNLATALQDEAHRR